MRVVQTINRCLLLSYTNPNTVLVSWLEKKLIGDKYFNGKIIRINLSNGQCHIKYCDGDSESMSEEEIEQHIMTF